MSIVNPYLQEQIVSFDPVNKRLGLDGDRTGTGRGQDGDRTGTGRGQDGDRTGTGRRQDGDRTETGRRLDGDRTETGRRQDGDWTETGRRLDGDWTETGQFWKQTGVRLLLGTTAALLLKTFIRILSTRKSRWSYLKVHEFCLKNPWKNPL